MTWLDVKWFFEGLWITVRTPFNMAVEYQNKRREKYEDRKSMGRTLAKHDEFRAKKYAECTHLKGGMLAGLGTGHENLSTLTRGGDSQIFAIIRHQLTYGDFFIKCLRCGKVWRKSDEDYQKMLHVPTDNTNSSSIQIRVHGSKAAMLKFNRATVGQSEA